MNSITKSLCFILALIMLAVPFVSCSDRGNNADTSAATGATAALPEESTQKTHDANGYILDTLPEDLKFNDAVVRVLYWKDVENQEYFAEEMNGETINDAIYQRNDAVTGRLGITFDYIATVGNSSHADDYYKFLNNAINGGDKYDIISAHSRSVGLCAYHGLTQDLLDLEYLNFEMPWWQKSLLNDAKINDQLHFVSGDISTNMLYMMYVTFYNKDMLSTYNLPDPYELVVNKEWTIDKMIEMSSGLYVDLDYDGKKSAADQYGQALTSLHTDAFLWGSNIFGIKTNAEGDLVITEDFKGERAVNLIDKLNNYFVVSSDAIVYSSGKEYKITFSEGRSLFITDRADIAINDLNDKSFAEMGIVPVPKYDTDQAEHLTIIGNPFSLYAIPMNAADPEMSSAVLECLASESYRRVTPAIFDITMKTRYSSDSHDAQMYDLARAGAVYDLSRIFWKVFSSASCDAPDTRFENGILNGAGTWVSGITKSERLINMVLQSINKAF